MLVGHMDAPDTKLFVDVATMFTNSSALSIGFGLSSALDTLCSQAYGAQRYKQIGIYLQSAIIVIFGFCLVPIFLLNWHTETFLLLVGQDPHVAKLAGEFSRITVFGTPFLFIYEMQATAGTEHGASTGSDHGRGQRGQHRQWVLPHLPHLHGVPWRRALPLARVHRTTVPFCLMPYLFVRRSYYHQWGGQAGTCTRRGSTSASSFVSACLAS